MTPPPLWAALPESDGGRVVRARGGKCDGGEKQPPWPASPSGLPEDGEPVLPVLRALKMQTGRLVQKRDIV